MSEDPGVSILIPYRDHIGMTRECVEAIRAVTRGVRYEILLLDNWSQDEEAEGFAVEQGNLPDTRVIRIAEPFNYSRINNRGVEAARHPFLLFMNNDVFVSDPEWLRTMLNEALADPGTGAVGAKLLYPNETVQHAGVVLGSGGIAEHAFRGIGRESPGWLARAICAAEVSAVTAACMLVRRDAFEAAGGFDEDGLSVAFNDVDLCMKIRAAGYRIIFSADTVCEHRESLSRGDDFDESKLARFMLENETMRERWDEALKCDPFYNPHFSREGGVYRDLRVIDPADVRRVSPPAPARFPVAAATPPPRPRRKAG
jgi:GT2 family glycosyltransferase